MFVTLTEEMGFCWVEPRTISTSRIVCPPELLQTLIDYLKRWGFTDWTMNSRWREISVPTLGQMDHNDMWLLTFHERHAQKMCSWVIKVKQRMQIQVLLCIIPNFLRKCQSANVTWDGESWTHKSNDSNSLTICSESHPFWERNVYVYLYIVI